jgi:hypothetical protein
MKWPFRRRRDETDIRIFRDPKTGELTLRLNGSLGWPSGQDKEPVVALNVTLSTVLTESVARQLRDQINALISDRKA